jgi:Outer membrane lipoprotein-sorting protein
MKQILRYLAGAAFGCVLAVTGAIAAPDALQIARERKQHDSGWGASEARMEMTLHSRGARASSRSLRLRSLETSNDGNRSVIIFDTPLDVKGAAVLTHSHIQGPDDQWLYLPSIRRVKRISSDNKSGAFMGSEFAFEDLSSYEVEKYSYKYLGEEKLGELDCYKLESQPRYEHSGYTRLITWIDKDHYRVHKIEYYDKKGSLLKTQTLTGFRQHAGKYWRADTLAMENHQTGKRTILRTHDVQFGVALSQEDFTQNVLARVR